MVGGHGILSKRPKGRDIDDHERAMHDSVFQEQSGPERRGEKYFRFRVSSVPIALRKRRNMEGMSQRDSLLM